MASLALMAQVNGLFYALLLTVWDHEGAVNRHVLFLNLLGKSMLLSAIGYREIPIPEHIDIYHLTREMAPSDKTALQCVMDVDEERIKLEKETERLAHEDCESCQLLYRQEVFY